MQPTKNQIALAELKFSYQALKRPLDVSKAKFSFKFLKYIACKPLPKCQNEQYILFVNEKHHVFAWYSMQEFGKAGNYLQQMAGLAQACNAYGVVLLKYCNQKTIVIDDVDKLFLALCYDTCEKLNIDIVDYIICNSQTYLSYKGKCLNN
jgi:DNA repair protein RadC